ncbi:jg20509 [Pararge aegeria aegeria]|uniref:Jg20509 protein n=1 Tax=Pararge aegeria aegeria TaxID=348720 RepID=A0A8S4QS05_9NEOP|nr:jg20509 [Pararge aegeria aegeria]
MSNDARNMNMLECSLSSVTAEGGSECPTATRPNGAVASPNRLARRYPEQWITLNQTMMNTRTEKYSSRKHFPVVGIEPIALDSESMATAHCVNRPSYKYSIVKVEREREIE